MNDSLDQTTVVRMAGRIRERLRVLNMSPRAASLETNRGPDVIRNLLRAADVGKPYNPRSDTLDSIARVLQVSPVWLRYGKATEDDPKDISESKDSSGSGLIYSSDTPDFRGVVETEVFKKVFLVDEDLGFLPPIGVDPRYPKARQGIWLVRGDGGARAGIANGMYVSAVIFDDYTQTVGPLQHGMYVIVERAIEDGLYREISIREYRVWPERIEFAALSPSRAHDSLFVELGWSPSDYPIAIVAVITGAHLPFENEGFLPHYY